MAVSGITNATAITADQQGVCALLATGEVDCWGSNSYGELGSGSPDTYSSAPVPVSGITNTTAISAGGTTAGALLATGGVDCWGENANGQLGNGTTTGPDSCDYTPSCSRVPISVSTVPTATGVAVGGSTACALPSTGGIDCWGWNGEGQLGDGTTTGSSTPAAVVGFP